MCTVSFVPLKNKMVLTSNRDEHRSRSTALPPKTYDDGDTRLIYPKDADKGGTWFALKENGDICILLNGADTDHRNGKIYGVSRGQILLSIIRSQHPLRQLEKQELHGAEPFTLILLLRKRLYQFRWNGRSRSLVQLSTTKKHIRSSATLYDMDLRENRKQFFESLHFTTPEDIIRFHKNRDESTYRNILLSANEYNTVSITSAVIDDYGVHLRYKDLITGNTTSHKLLKKINPGLQMLRSTCRTLRIKTANWEYWPFQILYLPVYFYYAWLSIKARSLFFFNAANPNIENGGFLMESKIKIYDQLPQQCYPTTVFCEAGISVHKAQSAMISNELSYPIIAKPNIGLRGLGVKLLSDHHDLNNYIRQTSVDFLLQNYVNYEKEAGIFYCRYPDREQGFITGIVLKEFLTICGDGIHSVEELMLKEDRSFLQLRKIEKQQTIDLHQVLRPGEKIVLPYGNHSRGAKFIDGTNILTPELNKAIDEICTHAKDFHYGRLDIRFKCLHDLKQGKNFSVIELNGAGSEPAHIYDPEHSVLFAWKTIMQHLHLLYRISMQNKRSGKGEFLSFTEGMQLLRANKNYMKRLQQPIKNSSVAASQVVYGFPIKDRNLSGLKEPKLKGYSKAER